MESWLEGVRGPRAQGEASLLSGQFPHAYHGKRLESTVVKLRDHRHVGRAGVRARKRIQSGERPYRFHQPSLLRQFILKSGRAAAPLEHERLFGLTGKIGP